MDQRAPSREPQGAYGSSGMPRSSSQSSFGPGGEGRGGGAAYSSNSRGGIPEPIFNVWQPTARVLAMSEDTVKEIRQRLKVIVTVEEGEAPPAAPIESFAEMVSAVQSGGPQLLAA